MNNSMTMFVASPEADKKRSFIFDQITFEYDALRWTDDIYLLRKNNPSLSRPDAVKTASKNTSWHWVVGNMPVPDIARTDYGSLAFNAKAMQCFSGMLEQNDFLSIGNGWFLFVHDVLPSNHSHLHLFSNEKGEMIVSQPFKDRYHACGLVGLKFSDPSVPFWKR